MTEEAETAAVVAKKKPAKKAVKKPAAKKAAPAKKPARTAAKKATTAAVTKSTPAKAAKKAAGKRGRPAAKKTGTRRSKKNAKQFAYMLLTPQEDGSQKASSINGPFSSDKDALDDASIMADDTTTIVLFREAKRGKVQKSTKFVAGR